MKNDYIGEWKWIDRKMWLIGKWIYKCVGREVSMNLDE